MNCYTFQWQFVCSIRDEFQFVLGVNELQVSKFLCIPYSAKRIPIRTSSIRSNSSKCCLNVSKTVVWHLWIWKRTNRIWMIASSANASEQSQFHLDSLLPVQQMTIGLKTTTTVAPIKISTLCRRNRDPRILSLFPAKRTDFRCK